MNASLATLGGGKFNTIKTNASSATLGGGCQNTIQLNAGAATLGGGYQNTIQTDADGVALAAIQGLNLKVEEQRAENAALKRRQADLERLVDQQGAESRHVTKRVRIQSHGGSAVIGR